MEESNKAYKIIIAILILIIVALAAYFVFEKNNSYEKVANEGRKSLLVLDDISYQESEDDETVILKVKNTSSQTFNNVTPVLIYYDNNNMPIHEGWGARIAYWADGDTRCIRFYDTIKDYGKVEVGLFDREDEVTFEDLRDKIVYEVEKVDEPDENGEIKLQFKGENKSDKDIAFDFEIAYYSEDKLIYQDQFGDVVKANSSFDTYEYLATKFNNGNIFPEGYTYEVSLVEAVEYFDEESKSNEGEDKLSAVDVPEDTVEDKIESAIHKLLKKNYGDKLDSAKIYVDKTYTAEQAKKVNGVKDLDLGENDVAFEVSIHLLPAEGADPNEFIITDGEYNEETGWVSGIGRLGVLRETKDGEYEITNYGTGW